MRFMIHKRTPFLMLVMAVLIFPRANWADLKAPTEQAAVGNPNDAGIVSLTPTHEGKPTDKAAYDFGTISLMDTAIDDEDWKSKIALKATLPGIKHSFVLKNATEQPIEIDRYESDCSCILARIQSGHGGLEFPYVVPPAATVTVLVALNHHAVAPGRITASIKLMGTAGDVPLATLVMKGNLDSGIRFSPETIKFEDVPPRKKAYRDFSVTLDRRLSWNLPPGSSLELISTNPNLTLTPLGQVPPEYGVVRKGNTISLADFMEDANPKKTPMKEVVLKYRISLSDKAPNGPVGGRIKLAVVGFPVYMLVDSARIQITGSVAGHIRSHPRTAFIFETVARGQEAVIKTEVYVTLPMKAEDIVVRSNAKSFTPRLFQITKPPGRQLANATRDVTSSKSIAKNIAQPLKKKVPETQQSTRTVGLEVSLDRNALPGVHEGVIIVSDPKSGEHVDMKVHAYVSE